MNPTTSYIEGTLSNNGWLWGEGKTPPNLKANNGADINAYFRIGDQSRSRGAIPWYARKDEIHAYLQQLNKERTGTYASCISSPANPSSLPSSKVSRGKGGKAHASLMNTPFSKTEQLLYPKTFTIPYFYLQKNKHTPSYRS